MDYPDLAAMQARHRALAGDVIRTPSLRCASPALGKALQGADIFLKLEMLQHTGSFKARGALSCIAAIPEADKKRGITAVSAGNHAIAAAWAAKQAGISAKLVLIASANPFRVEQVRALGAEIVFKDTAAEAFAEADRLEQEEGRIFVHPFEGENTLLGAAGVGLEMMADVANLEAVIVSIGGGGLMSGVATAIKAINPDCEVLGVEPFGAASMHDSLKQGAPVTLEAVKTLADSLGAPMALPYSFGAAQRFVDDVALVSDEMICAGLAVFQQEAKLAVEPAAGAVLAAALGPYRERVSGKRLGLVVCGANIDPQGYGTLLAKGAAFMDGLLTGEI